jgi:hypothetical protein
MGIENVYAWQRRRDRRLMQRTQDIQAAGVILVGFLALIGIGIGVLWVTSHDPAASTPAETGICLRINKGETP